MKTEFLCAQQCAHLKTPSDEAELQNNGVSKISEAFLSIQQGWTLIRRGNSVLRVESKAWSYEPHREWAPFYLAFPWWLFPTWMWSCKDRSSRMNPYQLTGFFSLGSKHHKIVRAIRFFVGVHMKESVQNQTIIQGSNSSICFFFLRATMSVTLCGTFTKTLALSLSSVEEAIFIAMMKHCTK